MIFGTRRFASKPAPASRTNATAIGEPRVTSRTRPIEAAAKSSAARMSLRNFARVYLRETGESPARIVERLRIEAAVRILESSDDPIHTVARRTGFGDDERMRRAFVKTYGVSPQDYRSRFGRLETLRSLRQPHC